MYPSSITANQAATAAAASQVAQYGSGPRVDQVVPGEGARWAFDGDVTAVFDDMLARSIPQYEAMRRAVTDLAARYARPGATVVDLGCSRGEALWRLAARLKGTNCRFVGAEVSEPMLEAARDRFRLLEQGGVASIRACDLRTDYPVGPGEASVTLCVLTLQFTPMEYRQRILRRAFEATAPGGALILVEKVLGATARLDEDLVDLYYDTKRENGYTEEQIQRKRLSLEGVLVPATARWNEELLQGAGFREVDCFWRHLNFAGWVAVRAE